MPMEFHALRALPESGLQESVHRLLVASLWINSLLI
jgi:hypothetical protein